MLKARTYLEVLWGLCRGFCTLLRQGQLLAYGRQLVTSYSTIRLNLFLSLEELRGTSGLDWLARRIVGYRIYNELDLEVLPWRRFRTIGFEYLLAALQEGKGVLIASHHLGPYSRIFAELGQQGFRVTLLVGDESFRALEEVGRRRGEKDTELGSIMSSVTVLNAEDGGVVRLVFEALSRKELVVSYIDGNMGAGAPGATTTRSNDVSVVFFGQRVSVRRGLCQISYLTGAPIVPLFANWERLGEPVMKFRQPILPDDRISQQEYCQQGMQELFSLCEQATRAHPAQYERWIHLHQWKESMSDQNSSLRQGLKDALKSLVASSASRPIRLDPRRTMLLQLGEQMLLIDGVSGRMLKLGEFLQQVLREVKRGTTLQKLGHKFDAVHSRQRVLQAVAQLQVLDVLEEVRS